MKRLLIISGAFAMAGAAHANLVSNGNFEAFDPNGANLNGGNYWRLDNGNGALSSWSIGDTSIDVVSGWSHFDNYGVDLAGSPGPGSIKQAIAITAGQSYIVSFWALGQDVQNSKIVVDLGGIASTKTIAIGNTVSGGLQQYTYTMTAGNTGIFSLGTEATNNSNGNLLVDNVQVNAVPEPFTMSLGIASAALFVRRRLKAKRA